MPEGEPAERLTRAMAVWLRHRQQPECSDEQLLEQHPELREVLEPLVADAATSMATSAATSTPGGLAPARSCEVEGRTFGSYRLLGEIGRGGVGVVFDAVQQPLGRRVALKVLGDDLQHRPQAVARFRREGELLARLRHQNIVPVFDAGIVDGIPFHAMERIDGAGLHEVLQKLSGQDPAGCDGNTLVRAFERAVGEREAGGGRAPGHWRNGHSRNGGGRSAGGPHGDGSIGTALAGRSHADAAVALVRSIALALCTAHEQGILHRDVKPANIFLRMDGTAMLGDFGLARDLREPGLTQAGSFAGTPFYVSPEQADGRVAEVDERSDVFSLAVVLYELLVLRRPFEGETTEHVLHEVRTASPPALRLCSPCVPGDLLHVLDRAMQKDRRDRYASMREFADELTRVLELRPVRARRRGALGRAWQAVRRQPRQSVVLAALAVSVVASLAMWLYLANNQGRIDRARFDELLPQVENHLEMAMLEIEGGHWRGAEKQVAAAAELLPDLPEALAVRVYLTWRRRGLHAAAPIMQRLKERAPDVATQLGESDAPDPQSSLGWFVRGVRLMELGHGDGATATFEAARDAFRRAIDRTPVPRRLFHCQYLHALTHLRDVPALRAMAADTLHLWPESPIVAYWRGFALMDVDVELAAAELERARRGLPDFPDVLQRLAKLRETTGDLVGAEAMLRELLRQYPHLRLPRVILARVLRRQRKRDEALAELEWLGNPSDGGPAYESYRLDAERASLLLATGDRELALDAADRAIAAAPFADLGYRRRASVYVAMRRRREALADADKACELVPHSYDCFRTRAFVCVRFGLWPEAQRSLERVVELKPDDRDSWCDLITVRRRQGDLKGAEDALLETRRIDPDYWMLHLQTGHLRRAQGRREDAQSWFEKAAAGNPQAGEASVNLASFRLAAKDYEGALDLLGEARRREPGLWPAWRSAVTILTQQDRAPEAEALLSDWCAAHPDDGLRWLQLAQLRRVCDGRGEVAGSRAEQALDHAAELLGQRRPEVLAERGEQALLAGQRDHARELFQRVLALKRTPAKLRNRCRAHLDELGG